MKLTIAEAAGKRCQESYSASMGVSPAGMSTTMAVAPLAEAAGKRCQESYSASMGVSPAGMSTTMAVAPLAEAAGKRCQESYSASMGVSPAGMSTTMAVAPFSHSYTGGAYGYAVVTAPMNCIGPQCMAWCWAEEKTTDGNPLGFCGKVRGAKE